MITAKFGRNELCPCGSEKKFKKCCSSKIEQKSFCAARLNTSLVTQLERFEGSIKETLSSFFMYFLYLADHLKKEIQVPSLENNLLADFVHQDIVKEEYFDTKNESLMAVLFRKFFFHWLYFYWKPRCLDGSYYHKDGGTLAEIYLFDNHAKNLTELHYKFIHAAKTAPYSFYEIVDVIPGKTVTALDLLTQTTVTFMHSSVVIDSLVPGMIVFVQLISCDGVVLPFGVGPLVLAIPSLQDGLQLIKKELQELSLLLSTQKGSVLTQHDLVINDAAIRTLFMRMLDRQIRSEELPEVEAPASIGQEAKDAQAELGYTENIALDGAYAAKTVSDNEESL